MGYKPTTQLSGKRAPLMMLGMCLFVTRDMMGHEPVVVLSTALLGLGLHVRVARVAILQCEYDRNKHPSAGVEVGPSTGFEYCLRRAASRHSRLE